MTDWRKVVEEIQSRGLHFTEATAPADDPLYLTNDQLEQAVFAALANLPMNNVPVKTRSKIAKMAVARGLGYQTPKTFPKTSPRFPHANFDLYVQAANNLQVWNQEVDPLRRYVVVGLNSDGYVPAVRVISGQELALLDTTGTLTSKYQAKRKPEVSDNELVSESDTQSFSAALHPVSQLPTKVARAMAATDLPTAGNVLSIQHVHARLQALVGERIVDPGQTQERLRGVEFQRLACEALEIGRYADAGQFPDIPVQALEVKLQLAPTVDLGLISPDSGAPALEISSHLTYSDMRYAVAFASRTEGLIRIEGIVTSTGCDFFSAFRKFGGREVNRKIQIRLPKDFFGAGSF